MLAQAVANKMKVVLDTSMLLGVAGNTGIPGLNGESGFNYRHYTGDSGTTGKAAGGHYRAFGGRGLSATSTSSLMR